MMKAKMGNGNDDAPVTVVEYGSFNCAGCAYAVKILDIIRQTYGDRVSILYKHLVKDIQAEIPARYYEAIASQGRSMARKFHDLVFENFDKFESLEMPFDNLARAAGADLEEVKKVILSQEITRIIKADTHEAACFDIHVSPSFVINGVRVLHTLDPEDFQKVINHLLKIMGLPTEDKLKGVTVHNRARPTPIRSKSPAVDRQSRIAIPCK